MLSFFSQILVVCWLLNNKYACIFSCFEKNHEATPSLSPRLITTFYTLFWLFWNGLYTKSINPATFIYTCYLNSFHFYYHSSCFQLHLTFQLAFTFTALCLQEKEHLRFIFTAGRQKSATYFSVAEPREKASTRDWL